MIKHICNSHITNRVCVVPRIGSVLVSHCEGARFDQQPCSCCLISEPTRSGNWWLSHTIVTPYNLLVKWSCGCGSYLFSAVFSLEHLHSFACQVRALLWPSWKLNCLFVDCRWWCRWRGGFDWEPIGCDGKWRVVCWWSQEDCVAGLSEKDMTCNMMLNRKDLDSSYAELSMCNLYAFI